jgi:ABC-type bacteriocin/lantibiotic exporter with double-glycine peptidase domain
MRQALRAIGLFIRDVRVPTRLQFQTTECGVAALAMVLAHHGRHVPNEELRVLTGVSRDCVNAAEIARAARHYGLECKAYSREPHQLGDLPTPFLAHLRFIHFVVVEGINDHEVLICDPHAGRSRIPMERFMEDFTGVVLSMKPGPAFVRDGEDIQPALSLWRRLGPECKFQLAAVTGWGLIAALLIPAWAILLGVWVDSPGFATGTAAPGSNVLGTNPSTIAGLLLLIMGLYAVAAVFKYRAIDKVHSSVAIGQAVLLARHFMALPAGFFVYRLPSKLHEVLNAGESVARVLCRELLPGLCRLCILPACLVAMARLHPGAAIAIALLAIVCLAGMEAIFHFRGDGARRSNLEGGEQPRPCKGPLQRPMHWARWLLRCTAQHLLPASKA